jgi:hypothetical protein
MTTFAETENYQYLLGLPIVSDLLKENKKLRKRNKELKRLIRLIGNNMSLLTPSDRKRRNPSFDDDYDDMVEVVNIKKEKVVVDVADDEPNIVYEIIVKEPEAEEEEEEEEEAVEEEEEEEEAVEEEEAGGVRDSGEADTAEEEDTDESGGVQDSGETDTDESGGIEEVRDSGEAEEEVYEVTIKGKSYYTTNETSGTIYGLDENGDVSLEVGVYKAGKPTFF